MARPPRPKEPTHRLNLVLPEKLHRKVQRMAALNHRSITAQIICALEWATREVSDEPVKHV